MIGGTGLGLLGGPASWAPRLAAGYETYRRMRRDPTIALARALAIAPVVAGKWTVEADADVPQEVRGWIDKQFLTVREPLLETILKHGYVDFGHQGFELVWGLDAYGRQCIVRFKPLLPDITEILLDDHGGLAGLRQREVELTGVNAMLVSFGGEGSDLNGEPLLENVREVWNDWRKANAVAARYDRKIAGAYLLLHYPSFGQGIDQNGAKLDNVYLAQRILDKLEAASGVAIGDVPSELAPGQDPNQTAWRLEVQGSAGGQQQGFVDRLRYLDSLKVRGMLLPERAILEGQHGTLAESQSQGDLAVLQAELVHHHITREINRQAVDPVLEANWGPAYRGKVRLEAAPLSSDNQAFLRQLVTQVLSDPKDFADLFHHADWSSIFDAVGLPQTKASSAAPSGPPAMPSAIGQLHREALEGVEETNSRPLSPREWSSRVATPSKDLVIQSQDLHNEGGAADTLCLYNFNPNQRRDRYGRWRKDGPDAADSGGAVAKPAPLNDPPGGGTRHYWEEKAKEIVGYGKDVDVIEMNRRITAAYAEMYLRSPSKFLWAGMAALASCDVGKGMIQAKILKKEAGTVAVGVGALATGMPTGTELMEALAVGNLYVYADMYSQHLAYSQGGLEEMKRLRDRGELSASCYDAWEKIDRGQVWEGNRLLLKWEQETTLQKAVYDQHPDAFKKLSWLARYMPALLDSPIPGDGNSFTKVVPNGNLGLFADRWKWIEQSMLPAWKKLVEHNQNEVRQSMEGFLKGKFHRPG